MGRNYLCVRNVGVKYPEVIYNGVIKLKTWFSADTHFGHDNIIKYTDRPFKSVEHMDMELIRRWNSKVKPSDLVIFLGDFCFGNPEKYLNKLNGYITFIRGNHDHKNSLDAKIENLVLFIRKRYVYCTHRPIAWNPHFRINLVGHIHNKWKVKKADFRTYLVNVGVDVWDYYPISFDDVLLAIAEFKRGKNE